jgi:tetratricopeptide (TPR) repeat protein
MFKRIGLISFLLLALSAAQEVDSLIDTAIELYETRHLNAENLGESAKILEAVLKAHPDNLRANYEFSKICYLLGDEAEGKSEKLKLYEKGKEYGRKAKKIDGNSAWAHFWYMVNLGRIGQTKGILNSLASVPEVKKEIDKVLKIDQEHTGALDAKAMLYYELPGLLGGNLGKSIEALNKGIELDSNYTLLYVDMAKVYIKKKEYEKARWFLNKAISLENPTYEADHVLDDLPEAKNLLKEIEGK